MKIIAFSDIHGELPVITEQCDVICIAGDVIPLKIQRNVSQSVSWFADSFLPWVDSLPCRKVILVAGNHDFWMETERWKLLHPNVPTIRDVIRRHGTPSKVIYLRDEEYELDGVTFYGSPWITGLPGWAFNTPSDEEQYSIFKKIPKNTDVLVTHTPPYGDVGTVLQKFYNFGNNYGSIALRQILEDDDWNIKYSLSGHIHSGLHAEEKIGNTSCYNVSLLDENYKLAFDYKVLELE